MEKAARRFAAAVTFVGHRIATFPFRIRESRTDNGHEFQAKFHWKVEDKGIRHATIEPSSPHLSGKVERSHRSDEQEFTQPLSAKGDVDLKAKLQQWQRFTNLAQPHGAHNGKTPYQGLPAKPYLRGWPSPDEPTALVGTVNLRPPRYMPCISPVTMDATAPRKRHHLTHEHQSWG